MKTVMKKMFCLLLVAVLLVGVMPFAAFAEGANTVHINVVVNGNVDAGSFSATFDDDPDFKSLEAQATGLVGSYAGARFSGWTEMGGSAIGEADVQNGWTIKANFTAPYCEKCHGYGHNTDADHCGVCGYQEGHKSSCTKGCKNDYNCDWTYAHVDGCKYNKCEICNNTKHPGVSCCNVCFQQGGVHTTECTSGCTEGADCKWNYKHKDTCVSQRTCNVCKQKGHLDANCPTIVCSECGYALATKAHAASCSENCTGDRYCDSQKHKAGCEGHLCDEYDTCEKDDGHSGEHTGVACSDKNCDYYLGHAGKHSYLCPTVGCDKAVGHTGNCSNDPVEIPGNSDLHVFVNLYTSNTLTKTVHLKSYYDISADTLIYDFISDHAQELDDELEDDGHYGYSWSGHVYDEKNKGNPVTMKKKVGEGATVHINAYSAQDLVYIYVHNSRSMSNLRIVQLPGKKVGETITKREVTNAVSKYFNVSSLSMYSEQGWEDYVDGDDIDAVSSLEITSDPYFIDVRISGTAKTSSGSSYSADSSNPKTGDTIFAPIMIMGASVSALAVLFYLNKKRAY